MLPFHLHTEKIAGKNRKIAAVLFRRFSRSAACRRGIAHLMFEFLDELLTMSCVTGIVPRSYQLLLAWRSSAFDVRGDELGDGASYW
jgi:hypothetical protein